ncbi:MAG: hypothetical protein BWY31_03431 [Lentisphaerae bacterium ADurb.Bin242]|nr:MAG: hypothetical protein BWY31_03431 [Lentisphaerae bacterium ADurb.Bin242]
MSLKTCILFLSVLFAGGILCAGNELVKDGKACSAIIVGEKPTRSAQFAAFELQHLIKLITDCEVPIVAKAPEPVKTRLNVGADSCEYAKKTAAGLTGEEYAVESKGNDIYLFGNDSPEFGKVDYNSPKTFPPLNYEFRGTEFAVYDFLEKACGVRFYSPGDDGTVYQKSPTLSVNTPSIRRAPKMDAFRNALYHSPETRDGFLLRHRWRTALIYSEMGHNAFSIYYRYWKPSKIPHLAKLFIAHHPEYFAQGYEGKNAANSLRTWSWPDDKDLPSQVCFSHPEVRKYFAREAVDAYNGKNAVGAISRAKRMPGKPFYYPMGEDDVGNICLCAECAKEKGTNPRWDGRAQLRWINGIAREAAKLNPDVGIATWSYEHSLFYDKTIPLEKNVSVQVCIAPQSWFHPDVYKKQHGIYKEWIENEGGKRPITVWTYLLTPAWEAQRIYKYQKFFPVLYPWKVGEYFKEFANDGVKGAFVEVQLKHNPLEAYVAARICDDPSVDVNQLIDEYFTFYYGKAGPAMRQFYKRLEEHAWNIGNYHEYVKKNPPRGSFTYYVHPDFANYHLGNPKVMAELQGYIDSALKSASAPVEKKRVQKFIDDIWRQAVEGRVEFEKRDRERKNPVPEATLAYTAEYGGDPMKADFQASGKAFPMTTVDGKAAKTQASLRFASDSTHFYVLFQEKDPGASSRPKADIWGDNLEIFFTNEKKSEYFQFAVAPDGRTEAIQVSVVNGVVREEKWNVAPVVKSGVDANGWTLKLAIPLKSFSPLIPLEPGKPLYANFFRTRGFDWTEKSLCWSPIFSIVHREGLPRVGKIFLARKSHAKTIDCNSSFKVTGDGKYPDGWKCDHAAKPGFENIFGVKDGVLTIDSLGRSDMFRVERRDYVKVNAGDKIVFEFKAKGKNTAFCGLYFYPWPPGGWNRVEFSPTGEWKDFKVVVPVERTAQKKGENSVINEVRILLGVNLSGRPSPSAVEIKNMKVSLQPGEK